MTTTTDGNLCTLQLQQVDPRRVKAALGDRVRQARRRRLRMTLAEFGRRVAAVSGRDTTFSNVTVANWESGRQEPSFASLQAVACLAQVPLCYFAGVGDLDEYPRIDWLGPTDHGSDAELGRLIEQLEGLPEDRRKLAVSAIEGLLEGLHRGGDQRHGVIEHQAR